MIVDKPAWVSHGGSAIYAVDVHPGGGRLATCGNDNAARVWNLLPILDAREEQRGDEAAPRLLAVLGEHSGPVNVVRFSRNGRWLASGSDDRVALVHELRPGGPANAALGGGGRLLGQAEASVENWRVVLALRGHGNNVADLAWSPDDRYIATASLDGTVIVWDVQAALGGGANANAANAYATAAPQRAATLTAHVGFVKGVAWDPMGTYLASQGDDGVRVWRTAAGGWAQVAHIEAPFAAASRTNFFLRLSWTPDGQYLVAANAYDRRVGRNVAPLFKRDVWRAEGPSSHNLVGHNAPVLSVRANPRLFSLPVAVRRDGREEEAALAVLAAEEEGGAAAAAQEEQEDAPAAVTTSDQQQAGGGGGAAAATAKAGGAAAAAAAAGKRAAAAAAAAKGGKAAGGGKGKGGGGGGDASADMDDDDEDSEATEDEEQEQQSGGGGGGGEKKKAAAANGGKAAARSRAASRGGGTTDASTEEEEEADEQQPAAGAKKPPQKSSKSPARAAPLLPASVPPADAPVETDPDSPTVVLAVTSADKQFTVWGATRARPLLIASGFHRLGVLDSCWTPDGYTLLTCSYDGTVSVVRFSRRELGLPLPDAEFRRMVESIYGDARLRGRALAEDPAQLLAQRAAGGAGGAGGGGGGGGGDALAARLGGGGGGAPPFPPPQLQQQQQQQRAVLLSTAPSGAGPMIMAPPAGGPPPGGGMGAPPPSYPHPHPHPHAGPHSAAGGPPPPPQNFPAFGVVAGSVQVLPDPPRRAVVSVRIGTRPDPTLPPGSAPAALALEAGNDARDHRGAPAAEITCVCGGSRLWSDAVRGQVVSLAGSPRFAAVGMRSGDLLLYTSGGRRALPPLALGAQAALMAADGAWRLAVLTTDARLRLYDVERAVLMVETSVAALLQPPRGALEATGAPPPGGVAALRLCRATGAPIVVLGNQHAHYYHQPLRAWLRVADDTFRASPYYSALPPLLGGGGGAGAATGDGGAATTTTAAAGPGPSSDLAALQGGVLRRAEDVFGASLSGAPQLQLSDGRAHLETLMASALAMGEPGQWRRWLRAYVEYLARNGDEGRLAELAGDLLGPPRWTPPLSGGVGGGGAAAGAAGRWAPTVLGLDKRRLLQTDVLPEANRVPCMRRFVQTTLDALRDAEAFVQAATAAELERRAQAAGGGVGGGGGGAAAAAVAVPSMFADDDPARGSAAPSMVAAQQQQRQQKARR